MVNAKRIFGVLILGMFLISMMGFVLGDGDGVFDEEAFESGGKAVSYVYGAAGSLLEPFFGETEMLSRVFFAILLGMIIYSIISVMFESSSRTIKWGITGAITSLALLGLPSGFLEAIRVQYGAMGAAILTVIPFLIILVFSLRTRSVLMARVTWIFYAAYYLLMYLYRAFFEVSKKGWLTVDSLPYLAGFIAGVMIFFFVPAIRNLIFKGEIAKIKETGEHTISEGKLLKELKHEELTQVYGDA